MSLSAALFGSNSLIFKATNIMGLGIPGLLHKTFGGGDDPTLAPQRLGEISQQTFKEGDPRVIVWGKVRPIGGNVCYVQSPVKRMVKVGTVKAGGKGGGKKKKQDQYAEHVFRTYAIGVCEGPITGYSRIWRNNKLVYEVGTEWGDKNNGVFLRQFRLYTGDWNQMPDPTLQSIWGQVPAHRGTAYMVAVNEDLTELGGSLPQFVFEVWREDPLIYLTSTLYNIEDVAESESLTVEVVQAPLLETIEESKSGSFGIVATGTSSGTWKQFPAPEELNVTGGVSGIVMTRTTRYSSIDAGVEELNATGGVSGIVMTRTTRYSSYTVEPQELNATGGVSGIVMTRTSGTA